jgi:hypothetical protein
MCGRELNKLQDNLLRQPRKLLKHLIDLARKLKALDDKIRGIRVPFTSGCPETFPGTTSTSSHPLQSINHLAEP